MAPSKLVRAEVKRERSLKDRLLAEGFPDPLVTLEQTYSDCLRRADAAEMEGNIAEAQGFRKTATRALKTLRQYGGNPDHKEG